MTRRALRCRPGRLARPPLPGSNYAGTREEGDQTSPGSCRSQRANNFVSSWQRLLAAARLDHCVSMRKLLASCGGNQTRCCIQVCESVLSMRGLGCQSLFVALQTLGLTRKDSPLYRFKSWLVNSRDASASSLPRAETFEVDLTPFKLPSHLPPTPVAELIPNCSDADHQDWLARTCAWMICEWLVAVSGFYSLNCPKRRSAYETTMGPWHVTTSQQSYAYELFEGLVTFCSNSTDEKWTRGRKSLLEALRSVTEVERGGAKFEVKLAPPLAVRPDRISVPVHAGTCDPAQHLTGRQLYEYRNIERLVQPEGRWELPLPRPCHVISLEDEAALRDRLLENGMARLVDEDEIPRDSRGRKLVAGLFAVEHKVGSDRLIIDRRLQNATEGRFGWAELPHGTLLCKLVVHPDQAIRASIDDISCFFYCLRSPPQWVARTAFGRVFTGKEAERLGGSASRRYHLGLRVWAMGDSNAVDVAQATHESILRAAGCLRASEHLKYNGPFPAGKVLEGVYVDDHVVIGLCRKDQVQDPGAGEDTDRVTRSREAYAAAGLPVAPEKSADRKTHFVAWGTEVCSESGLVGAPVGRRLQIIHLLVLALANPYCTRELLECMLGSLVHPLMHRRCLMSTLGRSYRYCRSLDPRRAVRLSPDIVDEFRAAIVSLAIAATDVRAPVSPVVYCSDATPKTAASVQARVSRPLAENLHSFSEHKGAYTRLDWSAVDELLHPLETAVLPEVAVKCIQAARWRVRRKVTFKSTAHVNLQEARGVRLVVRDEAGDSNVPRRVVILVDSKVVLGAVAKGRSSSSKLNGIIRSLFGYLVFARFSISLVWIESALNPADDPTRDVPLRTPMDWPEVCELILPAGIGDRTSEIADRFRSRLCLEVFAGQGGLTSALLARGLSVGRPIEAYPCEVGVRGTRYVQEHDLREHRVFQELRRAIRAGCYGYVHFGFPCTTFSILRSLSVGTRGPSAPEGTGFRDDENEANWLLHRICALCQDCHGAGCFFSIENPKSSYLWHMPDVLALSGLAFKVDFDQCEFGLSLPGSSGASRIRKPTTVLTNLPELRVLARTCKKDHDHVRCWGSARIGGTRVDLASWAGVYPKELCRVWAQAVAQRGHLLPSAAVVPEVLHAPSAKSVGPRLKAGAPGGKPSA